MVRRAWAEWQARAAQGVVKADNDPESWQSKLVTAA
jgi:hypothetical protein